MSILGNVINVRLHNLDPFRLLTYYAFAFGSCHDLICAALLEKQYHILFIYLFFKLPHYTYVYPAGFDHTTHNSADDTTGPRGQGAISQIYQRFFASHYVVGFQVPGFESRQCA
jgi:hypothetical protein